jgi:hypothetical protein
MKKIFFFLTFICVGNLVLLADEGMWVPLLLDSARYQRMVDLGCKLSKEDIFSMNNSSLKDAVVLFDRGCTGVLVSNDGLLFTNHHCGYRYIQNHSAVYHDYLTNGFTAHAKVEELLNPGLKVYFLNRIEDVTDQVLHGINQNLNETQRNHQINLNIGRMVTAIRKNTTNSISVKPFFGGTQYLMFDYEVFSDVRLVLAPPSEIGKFGGDTDNWVWPRHTGDFTIFRVYANKENKPALYSPENVPYHPKKAAAISLNGIKENDFTMVLGYPASTEEYVFSEEVAGLLQVIYPNRVKLRKKRLDIMALGMEKDAETRIKYASKYYGISNGWKKWDGSIKGLDKANAIEVKRSRETRFINWLSQHDSLNQKYGNILNEFRKVYPRYNQFSMVNDYRMETFGAVEIIQLVSRFYATFLHTEEKDTLNIKIKANNFINYARSYFKNFDITIDKQVFTSLLEMYAQHIPSEFQPSEFKQHAILYDKQFAKWADKLYATSIFSDSTKLFKRLRSISEKNIEKFKTDQALSLYIDMNDFFETTLFPSLENLQGTIDSLNREYNAILKIKDGESMYPDANFTFRISFGKVEGYSPSDAIYCQPFTHVDGIIEKENPEIFDYRLSDTLRNFYKERRFGFFADSNGNLPVCFIATNHTSGGNSGSPVFNGKGELIGLNFDRCWEGTMSDLLYDSSQCRNISVDIRYLLYMVANYANAGYLLEEMKLLKE